MASVAPLPQPLAPPHHQLYCYSSASGDANVTLATVAGNTTDLVSGVLGSKDFTILDVPEATLLLTSAPS